MGGSRNHLISCLSHRASANPNVLVSSGGCCNLSLSDPDPEKSVANYERTIVAVNEIPIEQTLDRPLRIRSRSQAVPLDESACERFDSSRFGREPL